jgi:anti-sigma regulatory factor (Ser/Thr protein kinase)
MAIAFQAKLPGTPQGVRMLRHEMSGIAADCGLDAAGIADVRLAVTEAATNAVIHAYADAAGELAVTAAVEDSELAIVISDTGAGLAERPDSPGLGAGLSVIATVAARLKIVSRSGGTEVHMAFPCPNADQLPTSAPRSTRGW